jgi:hypothetical protein
MNQLYLVKKDILQNLQAMATQAPERQNNLMEAVCLICPMRYTEAKRLSALNVLLAVIHLDVLDVVLYSLVTQPLSEESPLVKAFDNTADEVFSTQFHRNPSGAMEMGEQENHFLKCTQTLDNEYNEFHHRFCARVRHTWQLYQSMLRPLPQWSASMGLREESAKNLQMRRLAFNIARDIDIALSVDDFKRNVLRNLLHSSTVTKFSHSNFKDTSSHDHSL